MDDKRGQTNATSRESKDNKGRDKSKLFAAPNNDFEPFDFDKISNY